MGAARVCILFTALAVAVGTSFLQSFFMFSTVDCLLGLRGNIYDEKMMILLIMVINCILLMHGWAGLLLAGKKCQLQCVISTWLVFSMCFIYGYIFCYGNGYEGAHNLDIDYISARLQNSL
ncbi:uncharacterized protein [Drosophila virilis]|uniref:uncharacterized protein n=1 Tax=Drosophila virilis TaxID=7244 RepID=UPI0038B3553D